MGLIKAALGAAGSALGDQWKEYFYCESLPNDTIMVKGRKRVSSKSSNKNGSDNVISNGSVIAVADGQCMIIVEQGKVAEICAEPGEFIYDSATSPTIFAGNLGDSIGAVFADIGKRFTFGGSAPVDQRVYYFNTKEIMGFRYGTASPIPFRVYDKNINFDVDVSLRCNGTYSIRICNPILFYTNVCGNVSDAYRVSQIEGMMKGEVINALMPALGRLSEEGIRPSGLPAKAAEITKSLNEELSAEWRDKRGIEIASFTMNPPSLPEEDQEMLKQLQRTAVFRDPSMGAATMVNAQAEAMKTAAGNAGGAMMGFMGMNMAQQQGGLNAQSLYGMAAQQQAQQAQQPAAGGWKCSCGAENTGKFCTNCGAAKPADAEGWSCSCGAVNKGKFCMNCGKPKPAGAPLYKCDKCGWEPADPHNPPKFCPECGDPFDANDLQ